MSGDDSATVVRLVTKAETEHEYRIRTARAFKPVFDLGMWAHQNGYPELGEACTDLIEAMNRERP